jgi:hypothetical protein
LPLTESNLNATSKSQQQICVQLELEIAMITPLRQFARVYISVFFRVYVLMFIAGLIFNAGPYRLFQSYGREYPDLFTYESSIRAVLMAAIFMTFALWRKFSTKVFFEEKSVFGDVVWRKIYILMAVWAVSIAAFELYFVKFEPKMLEIFLRGGIITLLLVAVFAISLKYAGKARTEETYAGSSPPPLGNGNCTDSNGFNATVFVCPQFGIIGSESHRAHWRLASDDLFSAQFS